MRIDFPELAQQTSDLWERNAGWWDEQMGEGNVWHQTLVAPATERLLALREGERVIDLACGNGQFARRMAQFGAHVTAVDVSESMLDAARERSGSKTVVACMTLVLRATARALRPAARFVSPSLIPVSTPTGRQCSPNATIMQPRARTRHRHSRTAGAALLLPSSTRAAVRRVLHGGFRPRWVGRALR